MSKYLALWQYIKSQNLNEFKLSFEEIEKILDFPIDHSILNSKKELEEYGYKVMKISLKEKTVLFSKI